MKMVCKMALCCSVMMISLTAMAQKVIVEGDGSSVKAQMELYSRWTKSEAQKAQYASYAEPEPYSTFSTEQFKEIYEEQLKEMYRMVSGELIQVKAWRIEAPIVSGIAPKARLVSLQGVAEKVPQLFRVQIKRALGEGVYVAYLSTEQPVGKTAIVRFEGEGPSYEKGTVLEAYLVVAALPDALKVLMRHEIYSATYKCVPDAVGETVHSPTMKELAYAIKTGLKPVVLAPTGSVSCETCDGSGVDAAKLAAAKAAAKREANQLGRKERTYDGLGKRTSKRNQLGESKAFTAAKMKRNKPKCEACKGDGRIACDVFRTLIK